MLKVAVPEMFPDIAEALQSAGFDVVVERAASRDVVHGVDVVVTSPTLAYDDSVLESCPPLQLLLSPIIGVDRIDVPAATRRGILVANSPVRANLVGMAESTVMLMSALLLNLKLKEAALRTGSKRPDHDSALLSGCTVGFIGYGRIAQHVEERLAGWEVTTQHFDPVSTQGVALDELLRTSDVVSVHVVLNEQTRGMLAARELSLMKSTAILVNTSRGGVVDEVALARAIDEGRLRGAALDVFATEPIARDNPLLNCDPNRTILTPHCIGHNSQNRAEIVPMVVDVLQAFAAGRPPAHLIDPGAVERWGQRRNSLSTRSS